MLAATGPFVAKWRFLQGRGCFGWRVFAGALLPRHCPSSACGASPRFSHRSEDEPEQQKRRFGFCAKAGIVKDIRKVSEWLGHTEVTFTLRTYIHEVAPVLGDAPSWALAA